MKTTLKDLTKSQQKTGGACCLSFSSTLLDKTKSVRYNVHKR